MTTFISHDRSFEKVSSANDDDLVPIDLPNGNLPDNLVLGLTIRGNTIVASAPYLDAPILLPWNREQGRWHHQSFDLVNDLPLGSMDIEIRRLAPGFVTISTTINQDRWDVTVEEGSGEVLGP